MVSACCRESSSPSPERAHRARGRERGRGRDRVGRPLARSRRARRAARPRTRSRSRTPRCADMRSWLPSSESRMISWNGIFCSMWIGSKHRRHAVGDVRVEEGRVLGRDDELDLAEHVERAAAGHAVDRRDHRLPEVARLRADVRRPGSSNMNGVAEAGAAPPSSAAVVGVPSPIVSMRSMPVQNALSPAPVSTTQRTSSS